MRKKDLIEGVIAPTLKHFNMWSEEAQDLLLATAAQESNMGSFLMQVNGPALGIWQMEPATYVDIVYNVIYSNKRDLKSEIESYFSYLPLTSYVDKLIYDLRYACLFCRLQYWRYKEPLPPAGDVDAQFAYWKKYYNRNEVKGSLSEFVLNYSKYVKYG